MQNEGLWGIAFGTGLFNQDTNALFFSAGPNDEADGVLVASIPCPDTASIRHIVRPERTGSMAPRFFVLE
jgi:hypothetical protein